MKLHSDEECDVQIDFHFVNNTPHLYITYLNKQTLEVYEELIPVKNGELFDRLLCLRKKVSK